MRGLVHPTAQNTPTMSPRADDEDETFKLTVFEKLLKQPSNLSANARTPEYSELRTRWIAWVNYKLKDRIKRLTVLCNNFAEELMVRKRILAQVEQLTPYIMMLDEGRRCLLDEEDDINFLSKNFDNNKDLELCFQQLNEELISVTKARKLLKNRSILYGKYGDIFRLDLMVFVMLNGYRGQSANFDKVLKKVTAVAFPSDGDQERGSKWKDQVKTSFALARRFLIVHENMECTDDDKEKMKELMLQLEWNRYMVAGTVFIYDVFYPRTEHDYNPFDRQDSRGVDKSRVDKAKTEYIIINEKYFDEKMEDLKHPLEVYFRKLQLRLLSVLEPSGEPMKVDAPPMGNISKFPTQFDRQNPFNPYVCETMGKKIDKSYSLCNCDDCCDHETLQSRIRTRRELKKKNVKFENLFCDTHPTILADFLCFTRYTDWRNKREEFVEMKAALSIGNLTHRGTAIGKLDSMKVGTKPEANVSHCEEKIYQATSLAQWSLGFSARARDFLTTVNLDIASKNEVAIPPSQMKSSMSLTPVTATIAGNSSTPESVTSKGTGFKVLARLIKVESASSASSSSAISAKEADPSADAHHSSTTEKLGIIGFAPREYNLPEQFGNILVFDSDDFEFVPVSPSAAASEDTESFIAGEGSWSEPSSEKDEVCKKSANENGIKNVSDQEAHDSSDEWVIL